MSALQHRVVVRADGAITPRRLTIPRGDSVVWEFPKGEAVLPVDYDEATARVSARPFVGDTEDFTGPLVRGVPGIHVISQPLRKDRDGNRDPLPDWVWDEPGFSCVYLRLEWDRVQPDPETFEWAELDGWMNAAVSSGKYFGVSVKAGQSSTPRWLFDPRLGSRACVPIDFEVPNGTMRMGLPWDANYQGWYFGMTRALARHIRSNNGWWQRLSSVRVSGANYHSSEARVPNRERGQPTMKGGVVRRPPIVPCVADRVVWERAGYTPEKIYAFYREQRNVLLESFPGKDICFQLIQDGWPHANADDPSNRPVLTEQAQRIIREGRAHIGNRWIVQHLGILPTPDGEFPATGWHPITAIKPRGDGPGQFRWAGSGFPNSWALEAGIDGSPTAWQTMNTVKAREVESAIENAWCHSDGIWIEVYPETVQHAYEAGSVPLSPGGCTIAQWTDKFYRWRMDCWGEEMGDPFPGFLRHTFRTPGRYPYRLGTMPDRYGVVVVE